MKIYSNYIVFTNKPSKCIVLRVLYIILLPVLLLLVLLAYLTNSSGLLPSNDPCDDSFRMGGADDSEYVSSLGGGVVSGTRQLHLYSSSSIYSIDIVRVCESLYIGSSDNIRNSCSGSSIDRDR